MADLTKDTIKSLTQLCRIDCSEEEQEKYLRDLKNIFTYFEELQEVDTSDIKPLTQVFETQANVMREDEVSGVMPRKVFLDNAPAHTGGMIRVPPVMKGP